MDIKEYISSGIIERYVLNSASDQERQEVECMSHIYPEVKEELTQVQSLIENIALKAAVSPPEEVKTSLFQRIKNETQEKTEKTVKSNETKIIPLHTQKSNVTLKVAAAACVIGIIALGVYSSNLNTTSKNLSNQLVAKTTKLKTLESKMSEKEIQLAFLSHQSTNKVVMNGTESHPEMLATVYWNTQSDKVMMEVQNLPETTSDKQYQLWAIVEGKPKDMGVFDVNSASTGITEMKPTQGAVAFAVTLEPKGGSITPTMEAMYVIGNV